MNITIEGVNCSGKTTLKNAMVEVANEKVHTVSNFFENHCNEHEKKSIKFLLNYRPTSLEDELLLKLKWSSICLKRLHAINASELSNNLVVSDRGISKRKKKIQNYFRANARKGQF